MRYPSADLGGPTGRGPDHLCLRRVTANDPRTFWPLFGVSGPTMSMEQIRKEFFPSITLKTLANKASAGQLPKRIGDVFDTRDVADWWDGQRSAA